MKVLPPAQKGPASLAARRLGLALPALALILAMFTTLAQALGHPALAALGRGLVPMPPMAALPVALLAGGMLWLDARHRSDASRRLACGLALAVAAVTVTFALGHFTARFFPLERWLSQHWPSLILTSPLTDLALLCLSLAAFGRWIQVEAGWRQRQLVALLASAPLLLGLVVVISYAASAPLLYGTGQLPMALPTAACAVMLGSALLVSAGFDTWPLAALRLKENPAPAWKLLGFSPGAQSLFLLIGALVLVAGSYIMRRQTQSARLQCEEELSTIADLKVLQISSWFGERRADAEVVLHGELLQTQLRGYLSGSRQAPPEAELRAWMAALRKNYRYHRLTLFDARGNLRLQEPEATEATEGAQAIGEHTAEFQAALRAQEVLVTDLHVRPGSSQIHMGLWIPIGSSPDKPQAEGALLLLVDPRQFLYPLLQSWPAPSRSAETLLVRREGGEVLFLNDLRHRPGAALTLRAPLAANLSLPAAMAVQGREGLASGTDYRGVPVLSALRSIPGTDWHMVAKVDEAEIFGPLRWQVWAGGLSLMGLLLLLGACLGVILRRHDAAMTRKQLGLSQRFEWLMREANDIILLLDGDGRIVEANHKAVESYGYSLEDLIGRSVLDLRVPEQRVEGRELYDQTKVRGALRFETIHLRKDGSAFPVEVSAKSVPLDGGLRVVSFVRDISERRAQERELQRMTQLYAALGQVNEAIVRSPDREALFDKICQVMVDHGGFSMAWIGLMEPGSQRILPVARHGDVTGYLGRIQVESSPTPLGSGPIGIAVRQGCPCIENDFLEAADSGPWRTAATEAGFKSVAAFPIRQNGVVVGTLTVYAEVADFFGVKEAALLEEVAMDVSFALDHLDLDEQRRATELALLESERLLTEAEEAGRIGTYTWFITEDRWRCSPFLERIFGIGPEYQKDLAGWIGIVAPEFQSRMQEYVAGILERHERFDLDYPIVRPSDGARRWVHGQGDIHRDGLDRPVAMAGIIQDITDRKLAEGELRRSQDIFSKTFQACPEAIAIARMEDGRYIEVNDVFLAWMGRAREQVIGQTSVDLGVWCDAEDRTRYVDSLEQTGSIRNLEARFRVADGGVRDCLVSAECIEVEGQRCSLNFIWDITERKLADQALRKISVAMEQSPLSIVITNPDGLIEYVNPAFTQVTGYSAEEALGQNPRILKSPTTPPEVYRNMWETLLRGETWAGELENLKKGGEPFHERLTIAPVRDESGQVVSYLAIKADISREKAHEQERRSLESQLHQSQKLESLGSLAGGVAHDMNNVLGAILGLASALREKADPFSHGAKSLDTIVTACMRGRGVVKSLLYFAKKDLQEERLLDLNDLVREMSQLLSHTTLKRVLLKLDLQAGLGLLRGDPGALSHMLMNLCVNAMDAMPGGGTLTIATQAMEDGAMQLLVRDTGEGMSPEVLARAMEPFFTTKPQGKGTGLGLAMVYGTMKAHEGSFELRSRRGVGTEALLCFPPGRVERAQAVVAEAPVNLPETQAAHQVLLVDDDELIRESVAPLLEVLGHTVTTAPGAEYALRLLRSELKVDLVILDMNMPGMSGAEALPHILDLRPGLAVILATGYSDQEVAPLLVDHPSVSSLRKPFNLKELRLAIAGSGSPAVRDPEPSL